MKRSKGRKIFLMIFFGLLAVAVFSLIVMLLWNAILPSVANVNPINFWQALGILVLSKILFGGFGRGRMHWKERMGQKWQHMSPEEREQFKQNWRARCGRWGRPF